MLVIVAMLVGLCRSFDLFDFLPHTHMSLGADYEPKLDCVSCVTGGHHFCHIEKHCAFNAKRSWMCSNLYEDPMNFMYFLC